MRTDRQIPFQQIDLTDGFWYERQRLNADTTLDAVRKQFENTGRFDALKLSWQEGMDNMPHIFFDSDVAKWIESAAYVLEKQKRPELEQFIDGLVDIIGENQMEDGYFNSWFQRFDLNARFTRRPDHELYCAGHLIEAAVAYYAATGKDKLLKIMCKYADLIDRIFRQERSAAFTTPGHEEIELALIRLGEITGDSKYTELGIWFVEQRGRQSESEYTFAKPEYAQDHLPVRQQTTAEGHSVRALYLYMAMADVALKTGDEAMLSACRTLFTNTTNKRMYITGGVGSSRHGEAFTVDYDLMNTTAYTESCAAIALALFARRMQRMEEDGRYGDIIERVLYNGFLSSTSLDGIRFFYENPLEIELNRIGRDMSVNHGEVLPIPERVEVFSCSCCPPNITRFIASMGDFLYTAGDDVLYVHHYMGSKATFALGGRTITVEQITDYPASGRAELRVSGAKGLNVALRIPGWCDMYRLTCNGESVDKTAPMGYVHIPLNEDDSILLLEMEMPVVLMEANDAVRDDAGRVALMRGPVVYCLEGVDNPGGLNGLMVDANPDPQLRKVDAYPIPAIDAKGWRRVTEGDGALYRRLSSSALMPTVLNFVPYYTFANRGASDMQTWVLVRR